MATSSTVLFRRFLTKAKFRHMEVLLRVSELGSMRGASSVLGMAQPSISQLISELETLLETKLFFRHARGVEPTQATLELLPVARRILSALGEGAEILANQLEQDNGLVRVAATEAGLSGLIHAILPEFSRRNPRVHVLLNAAMGADPLALIAENACDILCLRQPDVIPEGWAFETCQDDDLITVCGTTHTLASQRQVTFDQLGQQLWLMNRVDSIARARFEQALAAHGWPDSSRCNIVMHIPEMTQMMLKTGEYLALIPRSVATPYLQTGTIVALDCNLQFPLAPLGYLWQGEKAGRAASLFASYLRRKR